MQALVTFSHVSWSPYTINDGCWFHGLLIQGTAHLGPLMYALSVAIVGTFGLATPWTVAHQAPF